MLPASQQMALPAAPRRACWMPSMVRLASLNVCLLLVWVLWVSGDHVKIAAEAYAERLLEACSSGATSGE